MLVLDSPVGSLTQSYSRLDTDSPVGSDRLLIHTISPDTLRFLFSSSFFFVKEVEFLPQTLIYNPYTFETQCRRP